jgi:hypothetical protein
MGAVASGGGLVLNDELVAEPESDVAVEPDAADADVEVDDSAEKYNKS